MRRLLVLLMLLATACGSSISAESGPVTLRLGYYANLTHAAALVGVSNGDFARTLGPAVTLKTTVFNAGPDAVSALLSNSVDASFVGPNPAISAFTQSHGRAVRVISGATLGGAALVVSKSITSFADLRGKTLATPQLGNTQDVALRYWLKQQGLTTATDGSGDVHIHPQDNATTLQTFAAGQIDGAWVPEPYASRLVAAGGHELVDESTLWPDGRYPTTVLVVRTDFLGAHPEAVAGLLKALIDETDTLNSDPPAAETAANAALKSLTGKTLTTAVMSEAWSHLTLSVDPAAAAFSAQAAHAHELGLLSSTSLKGLFDLTLLNQQLKALGRPEVSGD